MLPSLPTLPLLPSLALPENPARVAARVARVVLRAGFVRDLAHPALLPWLAREGLDLRTLHAVRAAVHPDGLAFVDERGSLTWAQADRAINRIAHALAGVAKVGERPGPVVLMLENRSEYLLAWFATMRLRLPVVHADPLMTADELDWLLGHSEAGTLLVSATSWPAAREVRARHARLRLVSVESEPPAPGVPVLSELVRDSPDAFPAAGPRADGDNIVYTSGTTGRPKGTRRNLLSFGLVELARILDRLPLRAGGRHLLVAPLHHSAAQVSAMLATALGATLHVRPRFDAADTLAELSRWNIEAVVLVPTMTARILDLPPEEHRRHPTPQLRALLSAASPFPHPLRERAIARFGAASVFDFYGATELGWVTLARGDEMLQRPGTVGRPLPGLRLRIEDERGRVLGPGETGRIFVRSAQSMSGYLRDRRATEEVRRGRWVTVDDLGHLDADGFLWVEGRARDLVISGGVNLYPAEIETVLLQHPTVRDVAVVGVPDAEWGERLVAAVVPGAGFDAQALEQWARARMSAAKVPRRWETLDELPRNRTGKVLKRELVRRFSSA